MLVSDDDAHSIIDHPEYWAEKNGQLVALDARGRDDARINTLKDAKRHARDYMLAHTDWMVMRHGDEALLGLPASEEQYSLASYRRYLRDFTAMHDWWALPTLTFEQFKLEQCGNE
jgi:hypothetical protein